MTMDKPLTMDKTMTMDSRPHLFRLATTTRARNCAASSATAHTTAVIANPVTKLSDAIPARNAAITVMTIPARRPLFSDPESFSIARFSHCGVLEHP